LDLDKGWNDYLKEFEAIGGPAQSSEQDA
jgi:hypothetical protein